MAWGFSSAKALYDKNIDRNKIKKIEIKRFTGLPRFVLSLNPASVGAYRWQHIDL